MFINIVSFLMLALLAYFAYMMARFFYELVKEFFTTNDANHVRFLIGLFLFFLFWFWFDNR